MRVVVQQPGSGGTGLGRVVSGGERAGVLAEQVVQLVAAWPGLGDQVLVIQLVELAAGGGEGGAVQGGGGVGVDAGARDQAEAAEQPPRTWGQVLVGQVERGRDRQVLGAYLGQPVARRGSVRFPVCGLFRFPYLSLNEGILPHTLVSGPY